MFTKWTVRSLAGTLRVWLFASLIAGAALFLQLPSAVLAQSVEEGFNPGANYLFHAVPFQAPSAEFFGSPTRGVAPLQVQFTDESTGVPTGWAWYFGDEDFSEPWVQMTASAGWSARDSHASVALPDGSIVLMGGNLTSWSPTPVRDVWRSTDQGATWTQMTSSAGWSERFGHASVALSDGSIVLMGGYNGSRYRNDVWRSTDQGATWTQLTASAPWGARESHTAVVLPDGSIVLMGGYGGSRRNDVWRSTDQGATWTLMAASAGWTGESHHASEALRDGSIVLMGGADGSSRNDVWRSTDQGATWTQLTANAEWVARQGHTSATLPDGSLILMGGYSGGRRNDVWRSTDQGATWTQITANAGWAARNLHTSVILPDGGIVLMGGLDDSATPRRNDVWRWETAGAYGLNPAHTYTEPGTYSVTLQACNSSGYDSIRKAAYIEVLIPPPTADFSGDPTSGVAPLEVQFTDESTGDPTGWAWYFGDEDSSEPWVQMTASAGWSARYSHASVVLPDGSIVLIGGRDSGYLGDVWRSVDQGVNWTLMTASAPWSARTTAASVVMPDGNIVLMGGLIAGGLFGTRVNDVWRSTDKGATWTRMTANAGWSARNGHTSIALPDGSIVLMGGLGGGGYKNDVWRSTDQGANWTQVVANAGWSARYGHTSVLLPDGGIMIMGGYDGGYKNDVWRSDDQGQTWTQVTGSAEWSARSNVRSVVLPDGSIILTGGLLGSTRANDVWRSTDGGATWTQITANAAWSARYGHDIVALPDGSIVLMGGYNGSTRYNDVWRWETAASYEQHPSHTYTEPGIYPVALQAYNPAGYGSTLKATYITVSAPPAPAAPGVIIERDGDDVVLSWLPVTEDVNGNPITVSRYEVWRSLSPYCIPGEAACPAPLEEDEPGDTSFVDAGAALTTTPYFYQVRAVSAAGVISVSSNEAGKFGFALAPGESYQR